MELKKSALSSIFFSALIFIGILFLLVAVIYPGYAVTIACTLAFIAMIVSFVLARKEIASSLQGSMNRYSIFALACIVAFFVLFSVFFLKRTELIFFDEQIYQSIAMNIASHGNALTCIYGTAQLKSCYANSLGFDPNGWPFLMAIAFDVFGSAASTAYGLEVFVGALCIISVFLISSLLTKKKEIPVLSALAFALIPELFIWSMTSANPNTPFVLFAMLTTFFFLLFCKKGTRALLALSLSSFVLAFYIRVEALLLLPILLLVFFTFGENGIARSFKERLKWLWNRKAIYQIAPLILIFFILMLPEFYIISATGPELLANALQFLNSSGQTFSLSYLQNNIIQNSLFLLGSYSVYPIIFLPEITALAIIGVVYLALFNKDKGRSGVLLLLLCMFLAYFVFYGLYFSGSALLGGSVRFLLILYPALSIFAAFGIYSIGEWIADSGKRSKAGKGQKTGRYTVCIFLAAALFVVPFALSIPFMTHPNYNYSDFPTIPNTTAQSNPYSMVYANRSLAFINENYDLVPADCLVFSPSPYLWYGLNRSSAYPTIYNESGMNLSRYSCFVLDYGYFCGNPFNNTACSAITSRYKLKVLATESGDIDSNFSLYQIMNYTAP